MIKPSERVLDWERRFDRRSLQWRVASVATNMKTRNCQWKRSLWLDQGREGACTGFGLAHVLGTTPRKSALTIDEPFAQQRYYRARQKDQWAGEDYEGSSVLGAMEAAREDGLIQSYYWATTIEEVLHAISYLGPMEIGVDWYEGMFRPDIQGFVHVTGRIAGGHALQVGGISLTKQAVRLDNSWGPSWGIQGSAWLSFSGLKQLLEQQGEFAIAKKFK